MTENLRENFINFFPNSWTSWWCPSSVRKHTGVGWRQRNQRDATNLMFIIKLLSRHVSGIIMPIIRRTRVCTAAYGVLHWLWWLWLCGAGMRAVCTAKVTVRTVTFTVHTAHRNYSVYKTWHLYFCTSARNIIHSDIQGDTKRWTQFRTSTFLELYTVCECSA